MKSVFRDYRLVGGNVLWSSEKYFQQAFDFNCDRKEVEVADVSASRVPLIIFIGQQEYSRLIYINRRHTHVVKTRFLKSSRRKVIEFGRGDLVSVHGLLSHARSA